MSSFPGLHFAKDVVDGSGETFQKPLKAAIRWKNDTNAVAGIWPTLYVGQIPRGQ